LADNTERAPVHSTEGRIMKNTISVLALALFLCALPAAAQNWVWSMPGSAGTPDNTTLSMYTTTGPAIAITSNAVNTAQFRYPVTNVYGSASDISPAWGTLQMTYIDDSATAASIVAKLMAIDKCSATPVELCSITSSDGGSSTQCSTCTFSGGLDFANTAYYVDVTITKTDIPPNPTLFGLAIY
jgi:hypothetical protein